MGSRFSILVPAVCMAVLAGFLMLVLGAAGMLTMERLEVSADAGRREVTLSAPPLQKAKLRDPLIDEREMVNRWVWCAGWRRVRGQTDWTGDRPPIPLTGCLVEESQVAIR